MQTAVRRFGDLRTDGGQKAAREAWEAPIVKIGNCGVQASAKRHTQHDRRPRPPWTRPYGGI